MAAMAVDMSTATSADRRRHSRTRTSYVATVNFGAVLLPCFISDLSESGARIQLLEPAALPAGPAVLESTLLGKAPVHLVWQKGLFAGLRYTVLPATRETPERASPLVAPPRAPEKPLVFGNLPLRLVQVASYPAPAPPPPRPTGRAA